MNSCGGRVWPGPSASSFSLFYSKSEQIGTTFLYGDITTRPFIFSCVFLGDSISQLSFFSSLSVSLSLSLLCVQQRSVFYPSPKMSYWKTKVVPKFKKLFDKGKKKAAAEACKSFDSSKESIEKELGDKESDLQPKVVAIYQSSTVITKKLLKEPSEPAVKESPDAAQYALQELAKAGFPGAQLLCDAGGKCGPALLPGPIVYLFQKASIFLVNEPLPEPEHATREIAIEAVTKTEETKESESAPETTAETASTPVVEEKGESSKEKNEVVPVEAKKEEVVPVEAKKEEVAPVEAKKEVAAPVEVKTEVVPLEAKKEETPLVEKKEEVAPAVKEEKKEAAPIKEEKKEEVVAPPSEAKKEELKAVAKVEEKEKATPTVPEKK